MDLHNKERQWAQLVVVDTKGRLLLFKHEDEALSYWSVAGGELRQDEHFAAAALTVLYDVAGLAGTLGPLLHECQEISYAGAQPCQWQERYFLVRYVEEAESAAALASLEAAVEPAVHPQWWSLEQMQAAANENFKPAWLPELLADVLASEATMPASTPRL